MNQHDRALFRAIGHGFSACFAVVLVLVAYVVPLAIAVALGLAMYRWLF